MYMKQIQKFLLLSLLSFLFISISYTSLSCSSFKLQKGDGLVYGHNLNEGDIGVPGMIFINKRGIFKQGRSWSELTTPENSNPSDHCWVSRYGSITFNNFGRDFPDGGMNEAGLFVWEMNETIEYPKDEDLPKLNQMNWMQFMLDNCSTVDEAVQCAYAFEIDGWGWHYFIGDATGNIAAIAFIKGEVVIHQGEDLPVPGLFNTPYERELEVLKYYKGFGGFYNPDLDNPEVPRFAKTAVMVENFKPEDNIVDYGLYMLDKLMVNDVPEWSILCDVRKMQVHFKTRINPEVKVISFADIDFSNTSPVMVLNMDVKEGGDVFSMFTPYTNQKMRSFYEEFMVPLLPEAFFTQSGISMDEYLTRVCTHTDAATLKENQYFSGVWKNIPDKEKKERETMIVFDSKGDAITVKVSIDEGNTEFYHTEHLQLIRNNFVFTFLTNKKTLIEVKGIIIDDSMAIDFNGIENQYGHYVLFKKEG